MLLESKKSSFGVLVRLSYTRFHLAPGDDFEKNHVKMVILKMIPQLPNLTPNFQKKAKKGPLSIVFLKHLTFGMIFKKII